MVFLRVKKAIYNNFQLEDEAKDTTKRELVDSGGTHWPSTDSTQDLPDDLEQSVGKPWFIDGGTIRPTPPILWPNGRRKASLWPQESPGQDRIIDQLMFVPR